MKDKQMIHKIIDILVSICSGVFTIAIIFLITREYIDYEKNAVADLIKENPILSGFDVNKLDKLSCTGITYLGYKGKETGTFTIKGNFFTGATVQFNLFPFPNSCNEIPSEEKADTFQPTPLYSSCDGSVINLSADTGCKYGKDTIKIEIQSEKTSQNQSLYSQRFCIKGSVLTLLMGSAEHFENNETAFHSLPQVHPQNINCPKLIKWLEEYGGMTMGIDANEEPLYLGGRVG